MEFVRSEPDVVRSASQIELLKFWNRQRAPARLPRWPGLDHPAFSAILDHISYADVVESESGPRLLLRYQGRVIIEAIGAAGTGKFLDEILPEPYRRTALATCVECVVSGLPVYAIADLRDRLGHIVHYERLLLPFAQDGTTVDCVMVSLEAVSPEGPVDHRDLFKPPAKPPAFAFCATIEC